MKHGDRTKRKILDAGLKIMRHDPRLVSLRAVANAVGLTHQAVLHYFKDNSLFDSIADYAVETGDSRVIVQLLSTNHMSIKKLSLADRRRHVAVMFKSTL